MSGPLTRVADAIAAGAGSRRVIVERTGLAADVVDATLEHLQRMGRLTVESLGSGCPTTTGCGGCPVAAGCASAGAGPSRGPVLLTLRR